jgi:ribose transport system substrate-binding protein
MVVAVSGLVLAGGASEADDDKVVIGFSAPYMDTPYDSAIWRVWDDVVSQPPFSEWEFVITDAQGDLNNQLQQLENLARRDLDGLIYKPISAAGVVPTIESVWERTGRELPIVTFSMGTDPAQFDATKAYVGPNFYFQGQAAAEYYVELIDELGYDEINYVMLSGLAGSDPANLRRDGFLDRLEEMGEAHRFNQLDDQPGDWYTDRGQELTENWITTFGDELQMIYAHNDGMAYGAVNALQNAGYEPGQVLVNGIDAGITGADYVKEGWMQFMVVQSPLGEVELVLEVMHKILQGEDIEYFNFIESPIINADNVDEWVPVLEQIWSY